MGPRKLKLVVSDLHLGRGPFREDGSVNVFEDFRHDGKLSQFLDYHCQGELADAEVELVVAGDFLSLLFVDVGGRVREAVTEAVSEEQAEAIIAGHPAAFDALSRFAAHPNRSITLVMGNHDPGLLFPRVREAISRRVGGTLRFLPEAYDFDGVHVEHGHQREPMNAFNPDRYFREEGGRTILNLPLGARYIIHVLAVEKARRPYIDRVSPLSAYYRWAIFNDLEAVVRVSARSLWFFLEAALRRIPNLDPVPVADLVRRFARYTAFPTLELEARRLLKKGYHTVIMGHTHVPLYREYGRDRVYVNAGSWNAMTSLDVGTLGHTERLNYVHVEYVDGRPRARLREWKGLSLPAEDVFA